MSLLDMTLPTPATIPPVEAKEYPLSYIRKLLLEARQDGPRVAVRSYAELQPYRRTDEGGELKAPEVDGDIIVLDIPDITAGVTDGDTVKVETALTAYLSDGGNLPALAMACIVVIAKQAAAAQGKVV